MATKKLNNGSNGAVNIVFTDVNGTEQKTTQVVIEKKEKRKVLYVSCASANKSTELTETAIAYIQNAVPFMVYTELKTIYRQSGNPFIFNLMNDVFKYMEHEQFLAIGSFSVESNLKETATEKHVFHVNGKIRVINIGLRKPVIKKNQRKKSVVIADKFAHMDVSDIIQECLLAVLEMNKKHMFSTFKDVYENRVFIYDVVQKIIRRENRKAQRTVDTADSTETTDVTVDTADNTDVTVTAEKTFSRVITADIKKSIEKFLISNLSKKIKNRPLVAHVYILNVIGDKNGKTYTEQQIANKIDVSRELIKRYIKYCDDVIYKNELIIKDLITGNTINSDNGTAKQAQTRKNKQLIGVPIDMTKVPIAQAVVNRTNTETDYTKDKRIIGY